MKTISVIVPVYNCEKHLERCVESILSQTYPALEVILVDDGSSDNSGYICDAFEKRDARVRALHQANGGVSSARNLGLRHAGGDYISFVDADDYLDGDMLAFLTTLLEAHNADISQCGYRRIVGETVRLVNDTRKTYVMDRDEALGYLITGKLFMSGLPNKLFRAEIIKDLRLDPQIAINEDVLFGFQAFRNAKTVVFSDYLKYNYVARFGESAVFVTNELKKVSDACTVNQKMLEAVSDNAELKAKAADRYLSSLFRKYRLLWQSKADKGEIRAVKQTIFETYKEQTAPGRNMKLSYYLLRYCPPGYAAVYSVYDKKRKPNWDVEVD